MQRQRGDSWSNFVNMVLMTIGYRFVTVFHDSPFMLVLGGLTALGGGLMLAGNIIGEFEEWQPIPRSLIPPPWLVAWLALVGAAAIWGTPHVAFGDDRRGCVYLGWNGVLKTRSEPCVFIRWFPTDQHLGA